MTGHAFPRHKHGARAFGSACFFEGSISPQKQTTNRLKEAGPERAAEDVIRVDRVNGQPGEIVEFGKVLVVGGDAPQLGTPTVAGATVAGEVLQHTRGDKVIAFKKRRRKNSRRKRGYRHEFSVVRITEILTGGAKPSKTAAPRPKREPKPKAEAEAAPAAEAKPAKTRAKKPAKAAAKKPTKAATKGGNKKK